MDHSENDKRFCVYVLKDIAGNIRYVGHGNKYRPKVKKRNNKELSEIIYDLTPEIISENLSKDEAICLEIEIYDEYKNSGLLLNKHRPSKINPIYFDTISRYVYYDESSPTFLRWKVDIYAGPYKTLTVVKAGKVAGFFKNKGGYSETRINKITYKNHRLIWCLHNKCDLTNNLVIDHIDGNPSNNNILNLRLVSQKENMNNIKFSDLRNDDLRNILVYEDRNIVVARWMDGFIRKSKAFNYKSIFPDIDLNIAKDKCIEIATWYKEQILLTVKEK